MLDKIDNSKVAEQSLDEFIGKKLCKQRKKLGISQKEFAKKLNCSYQLIQKQEKGEVRISASSLFEIAQNLGVTIDYFYHDYHHDDAKIGLPTPGSVIKNKSKKEWNILLIEDSPEDDFLMKKAFADLNQGKIFNIKTCYDGQEALLYLRDIISRDLINNLPDLIFIDLSLPKKDGFELLTSFKLDRNLLYIPAIIMTNSINANEMFECYNLHANGYITKSFDFNDFKRKIASTIDYWTNTVATPKNY